MIFTYMGAVGSRPLGGKVSKASSAGGSTKDE